MSDARAAGFAQMERPRFVETDDGTAVQFQFLTRKGGHSSKALTHEILIPADSGIAVRSRREERV